MLWLTAWILHMLVSSGQGLASSPYWRVNGPAMLGVMTCLLFGIAILAHRLEKARPYYLRVSLALPNPPEGRFLIGMLSPSPNLTAEQLRIRIQVQNPLWGMRCGQMRKWLTLIDTGGERIRVWGDRIFSMGLGYRVETFLDLAIPDYMDSICWGDIFPPRIYYKPQVPVPLHIRLEVLSRPEGSDGVAFTVRQYYLLAPSIYETGDMDWHPLPGAVREWSLHTSNWIGQRKGIAGTDA